MGQKVNPISLRLQKTNRHFDSCWYDDYNYTHLFLQDYKIKNYLKTVLHQIKYPESRVLNYGVPKKNIYNLFYFNPSNSRRKKSNKFQLQNFKEKVSKNKKGITNQRSGGKPSSSFLKKKDGSFSEKDVHSFFTFSEQQSLKSQTPTPEGLSHPRDQYINRYKKNIYSLFFSMFNPKENFFLFNKKVSKDYILRSIIRTPDTTNTLNTLNTLSSVNSDMMFSSNAKSPKIAIDPPRSGYKSKICQTSDIFSLYSLSGRNVRKDVDKKKSFFNINQLLLEFVIKNNENIVHRSNRSRKDIKDDRNVQDYTDLTSDRLSSVVTKGNVRRNLSSMHIKRDSNVHILPIKKLHTERFFARYLLAQLYCNYLQNKEYIYHPIHPFGLLRIKSKICQSGMSESYTTLYRFGTFFKEKNDKNRGLLIGYKSKNWQLSKGKSSSICQSLFLKKYRNLKENNEIPSFIDNSFRHNQKITHFEKDLYNTADIPKGCFSSITTNNTKKSVSSNTNQKIDYGVMGSTSKVYKDVYPNMQSDENKKKKTFLHDRSGDALVTNRRFVTPSHKQNMRLLYKSHIEYILSKEYFSFFSVNLYRTLIEKQSAYFFVQEIIYYLERKIPFRRIKNSFYKEIPNYKHIKGIRIKCSGRVGGRSKKAQRSKTQTVKMGQTSLGVFSSKIDFAIKSAYTRFGLIGVKVWVCYH